MQPTISGIHHVTAITADAQRNIDFYTDVLGLRLVKLTVNFDDPRSYHLYYGDELGRPGTIITFFVWPGIVRGRIGPPQVTTTAFSVPADSMGYWSKRFSERGVEATDLGERFGHRVLAAADPDGMQIELIGVNDAAGEPWGHGAVAAERAIRGFESITISEEGYERTAELLTDVMGFVAQNSEGDRFRFRAGSADGGVASHVDLLCAPDARHGLMGGGIVHHVAFRTPDDPQQQRWREIVAERGFNVSPSHGSKVLSFDLFPRAGWRAV